MKINPLLSEKISSFLNNFLNKESHKVVSVSKYQSAFQKYRLLGQQEDLLLKTDRYTTESLNWEQLLNKLNSDHKNNNQKFIELGIQKFLPLITHKQFDRNSKDDKSTKDLIEKILFQSDRLIVRLQQIETFTMKTNSYFSSIARQVREQEI